MNPRAPEVGGQLAASLGRRCAVCGAQFISSLEQDTCGPIGCDNAVASKPPEKAHGN